MTERNPRLLLAAGLLAGLAAPVIIGNAPEQPDAVATPPPTTTSSTTTSSTTTTTTTSSTTLPPAPAATAERLEPPVQATEPPTFDPIEYVNTLEYRALDAASAMEAYRIVATTQGWTADTITARAEFVWRIMAGESAFCWNARRWTYFEAGKLCAEHRTGIYDDVGFGQITDVLRPLTCERAALCTIADTLASPYTSMLAYVIVLDELGPRPWCYKDEHGRPNAHIRNGDCATWPGDPGQNENP